MSVVYYALAGSTNPPAFNNTTVFPIVTWLKLNNIIFVKRAVFGV